MATHTNDVPGSCFLLTHCTGTPLRAATASMCITYSMHGRIFFFFFYTPHNLCAVTKARLRTRNKINYDGPKKKRKIMITTRTSEPCSGVLCGRRRTAGGENDTIFGQVRRKSFSAHTGTHQTRTSIFFG